MRPVLLCLLSALAAPSVAFAQAPPETLNAALDAVIEEVRGREERSEGGFDEVFRELERQHEASDAAVKAAIAAEAAGAEPEAALRPIAVLEGRTPLLPRLAAAMQTVSPRTFAYGHLAMLWDPGVPADGPRPSKALALAAAAAWKAELAGIRNDPIVVVEVGALAHAYARLGELSAARRAVELDPRQDPLSRLELLTKAQAWDEAADLAARTTVGEVTAALMRDVQLEYEFDTANRSAAETRLAALLPSFDAKPDSSLLKFEAESRLAAAREELVAAARRWADEATAKHIERQLGPAG